MLRRAKKRSGQKSSEETSEKASRIRSNKKPQKTKIKTLGLAETSADDAEEERLVEVVLGGDQLVVNTILDQGQKDSSSEDEEEESPSDVIVGILDKEKKKPAWEDEDDEDISVPKEARGHHVGVWKTNDTKLGGSELKKRLQSQFEKTVGSAPSWAQLKSERKKKKGRQSEGDSDEDEEDEDEDDEEGQFLRRTGDYLTTSKQLPKINLNYQKVRNANKERPTQGRITTVQFHPTSQVLLAAGEDHNLNLFQVDGKLNPMIQTLHMERFPITRARFSSDGMEVIMTSRYKHFFVYNMIAGNIARIPNIKGTSEKRMMTFEVSPDGRFVAFLGSYGYIYFLSGKNKELIDTIKMNGNVSAVTFTPDGSQMLAVGGDDNEVYVWDMNTRDCVHKFVDQGCIKGTSVSVSRSNQYIACGCESGVVNIYDQSCLSQTTPKPLKSIMNLVTPATSTKFNHTNELVAISSSFTKNACKLVHLPSNQVFRNFPAFNETLGCPDSVDISPHSGYLTIGNSKGEALLYRLKHFTDY